MIASPTIETGVSIDIKGHFTSVWAIAQGTQTVEAVCQELERLRDDVPRHLWAAERGLSMVGKGETSLPALLTSQNQLCQTNIRLLTVAGAGDEFDALDTDFQPESLQTWAKRAILVNRGMWRYREFIIKKLTKEGYEVDPQPPTQDDEGGVTADEIKAEVKQTQQENHQKYCQQVSEAETPSPSELAELERRQAKTEPERQRKRKGELVKRYGGEITPLLVSKDDLGWYPKLRLHYYLTIGAEFLTERDKRNLLKMLKAGDGAVFKPDVNKRLRGARTKTLEIINLTQFLDPEREFTSESLADWQKTLISQRHEIKTLTGISINPDKNETPIQLVQRLLSQLLGLKLECIGKRGGRGNQQNVYRGCSPNPDGRQEIFEWWLERDRRDSLPFGNGKAERDSSEERLSLEREATATTTTASPKNVAWDTVSTLFINTYMYTQTVDTERVDTDPPTDQEAESLEPLPESWIPLPGDEVLLYTPLFENKWGLRGIVRKIAQHATDCWEVLVGERVRKVWRKDWLFPATDGRGLDST